MKPTVKKFALAAGLALAFASAPSFAQSFTSKAAPDAVAKTVREKVAGLFGVQARTIEGVRTTPIEGLFEVQVGRELIYSDAKGEYFVNGNILEARTQTNLTEQRLERLSAVDFSKLPLTDSFAIKKGNGQDQIAVFADPNCSYCKRLERELESLDNITIHVLPYPVLGKASVDKMKDIWCSPDKAAAWQAWMLKGQAPKEGLGSTCDTSAIDRVTAFGQQIGVTGTPAIVFADGSRQPGFVQAAKLKERIEAAKRK